MGVFDQAGRYTVRTAPAAFFAWRVPRLVARLDFRGWVDTSTLAFPGEPERVCDTVAELAPKAGEGPRLLLDVESQSEPDPDMLEREGEYLYRLRREKRYGVGQAGKYQVMGLVLNLTGTAQADTLDMRQSDLEGAGAYLRVVQVTMRDEDATETLRRIAAGELERAVLPWVPLMRGAEGEVILEEWKRLALAEPDERRREDLSGLALVFAELSGRWDTWKKGLEGWSMKQSQQVLEWQAEAREEGRQEVRRAVAPTMRAIVLQLLELRWQAPVPQDLVQASARCSIDELSRWSHFAQLTGSPEAFRAALGLPPPGQN